MKNTTMNTGAASLLPCPFCGCSASPELNGNGIGDNWLECVECGASTRLREDGAGSVKDWNRRASTPQADAAPIINGHAINDLFLKWSEWTTELGEAISRKNIDGFVSQLRAAIAAGAAQEAGAWHGCEPHGFAADCSTHTYAVRGLGIVVQASAFNALLSRSAAPLPRVAATVALTDDQIVSIWEGMPDGASGFRKSWGYMQFARALLATASTSANVAQGWKLVPVEPTDEMKKAGTQYAECAVPANAVFAYRAMLAAAPIAPSANVAQGAEAVTEDISLVRELQKALFYWMPRIAGEDSPAGHKAAEHAYLLIGLDDNSTECYGDQARSSLGIVNRELERIGIACSDAGCPDEMEVADFIADLYARAQAATVASTDDARECLADVVSHYRALYAGLAFQLNEAAVIEDSDDMTYWKHEIKALERMYAQAERALTAAPPAQTALTVTPAMVKAAIPWLTGLHHMRNTDAKAHIEEAIKAALTAAQSASGDTK